MPRRMIRGARVLNLASGKDYRPGWVNMDLFAERKDVEHDVFVFPWPFPDGHFDSVFANQILEHIPPMIDGRDGLGLVLREIDRILCVGGSLVVGTPYAGSHCDRANPTHYRQFNESSFYFLKEGSQSTVREMYGELKLRLMESKVARCFRGFGFDTIYHGNKYFGRPLNIGFKTGMVFFFRKVA